MNKFQSRDAQVLDLLRRLNSVRVNGIPVSHSTIFGSYNVWHFFQQRLYYEVRDFLETAPPQPAPPMSVRFKNALLYSVALVITLGAAFACFFKKRKVIVYSIDKDSSTLAHNDFRLNQIYQLLTTYSITYIEVFYTILNRQFLRNSWNRKRCVLYIKGIDAVFNVLRPFMIRHPIAFNESDLSAFDAREQEFIKKTISNYYASIERTTFRVRWLKHLFSLSGARILFLIDSARDYHEVVLAAKLAGVQSYAFQHGFYTSAFVGWLRGENFSGEIVAPDRLYVWNEYWKKVLNELGSVFNDIRIGGYAAEPLSYAERETHKGIVVLVPYEAQAKQHQVVEYIHELLKHPDVTILFKIRPDRSGKSQLLEYGLTNDNQHIVVESDTAAAFKKSDVVIGTYSTFLYDSVMSGRPVAILETDIEWGNDMVRFGLASMIHKNDDIYEKIKHITTMDQKILTERRDMLRGTTIAYLADTLEDIAREHSLTTHS